MRQKCEECGEYKKCNDENICFDCVQDSYDLEEWLPEDDNYAGESNDDEDFDDGEDEE